VQSERERLRSTEILRTSSKAIPLFFHRSYRARRYILRVTDDGAARVTIPRGGSRESARLFARQHAGWVQRQLYQLTLRPRPARTLNEGSEILYRGRKVTLSVNGDRLCFGDQIVTFSSAVEDFTALVRTRLWEIAAREFVPRALELAQQYGVKVRRILVRSQRSRWGSCSVRGTICLNWRILQAPAYVSEYMLIHELMHLREMNHSARFWKHVAAACPRYAEAEQWLDDHDHLLRQG